ncbi:DeoR/GlpR family DNA-binding transcription regulator [Paenibacillus allorhizosphaerae]|uniref:Glucitol operon repressor n=1 Tax=Paenibacillus allorhizosphaerae TaxID=2849866 RepID=A0ABM8VCX1_9BACL|nr:DeoR/GlpR family DNA-binding transcription regulator [Paenibacillus allorhizosphaerae]CAG7625663.1 Glucitol operon repressor [Paenibacillus allorhizosphaerae]
MKKKEKRFAAILELIENNQFMNIDEMCQILKVSPATVRRDLAFLEEIAQIKRVNGGALISKSQKVELPPVRLLEEKQRIAKAAVDLVNEGDTIFMDGGTTNLEIASKLALFSNITIVTTSIELAHKFSQRKDISIFVCGGIMSDVNPKVSIIGPLAEKMISYFRANICFLGTSGIHIKNGITAPYLTSAEVKNVMMRHSAKSILVADHSKFGKVYSAFVCPVEHFDMMITDRKAPQEDIDQLVSKGVSIKLV